jgi:2-polyprenyl-6-hydroxyphenyl methylase/3-demethylubiquinone-9 3-methyltransferase
MVETEIAKSSIDPAEVARFSAISGEFWDPSGSMRMLHRINPVRLRFIRDQACRHFGRDPRRLDCLEGLRVLDIGCGGGILCEPLARLGAALVGADPAASNIEVARRHAAETGVTIDYRATTAEALAAAGEAFDLVLAMEVVEHVTDMRAFVGTCAALVKPNGLMIAATINRTLKSFALAIVGAEYLLRWLPRGTHRWDKLVTPNELEAAIERAGLRALEIKGVVYDVFSDSWKLSDDTDVNYMIAAVRRD